MGKVVKVSGPLVVAEGIAGAKMYDVVRVGRANLIGEIIEIRGDLCSLQVYEETSGLAPEEPVVSTGQPLAVELGPGLIGSIFDGIQRPLDLLARDQGDFLRRGLEASALDRQKKWEFKPLAKANDQVSAGDILGEITETPAVTTRIMVPPGLSGRLKKIAAGELRVEDEAAVITTAAGDVPVKLYQKWPVRQGRPYRLKRSPDTPLITGQRSIDTFFPVAKGGVACIPGPFGSGKTVVQHQLSKWADADIIVFIGCGERGNEMASVLLEFPELTDPRTGRPLMERTVLIANTSNMPVAAREASVYTGLAIAEYFRDMGYNVALMADSTSRWAEALREMSGRLEEMPGEEGYPAYLGSRLAGFYERAGLVDCLGRPPRSGALTVVGAVSPPGGDLSEPVTQNTLRVVKVFWALEADLAYRRHFPAISWLRSYSLYLDNIQKFLVANWGEDFPGLRDEALKVLQLEEELAEIVRLVGLEALSPKEQLVLEVAKSIREDFLHQVAFDQVDTYTSPRKQYLMLKLIMDFYRLAERNLAEGQPLAELKSLAVREQIARAKYVAEDRLEELAGTGQQLRRDMEWKK